MRRRAKWLVGALIMIGAGSSGIGWAWAEDSTSTTVGISGARTASFTDLEGHWAQPSIGIALEKGYVDGYEDGSFKPDQQVSRAEFVKMAITALKLPVSGATTGAEWYLPYVNAAASFGIHRWSDMNTGDWNTPMSRYEMARMASRAAGQDTDEDKKWMYLATKAGLIQGMDDTGTLAEDGTTTRGQAVTIIERILEVKAGKELPVDKHAISRAEVVWHKTNIFTVMPQYFGTLHKSSKWDPEDLYVESEDGNYRGELDALLAIDLQDPNDPFLGEVPPVETLRWYNYVSSASSPYLTAGMPAYLLVYQGREVYNYKPEVYVHEDWVPLSIVGQLNDNWSALEKGNLNGLTSVFKAKDGDMEVILVPKKLKTKGYLSLELYTPSISGNKVYRKSILYSITPEWIE